MKSFMIDEQQLKQLEQIKSRLFTETRMNGDEMRDAAQAIDYIVRIVRELEIPEETAEPVRAAEVPTECRDDHRYIRMKAQDIYGDDSHHDDVIVDDSVAPDRVDDGYWVTARLWVSNEWLPKLDKTEKPV